MSHPALFRALQSSSLARVGTGGGGESGRARGPPLFEGEVLTRHTEHFSEKYHFADKAKREAGGGNDKDGKGGSDSKKKKSPIHEKGRMPTATARRMSRRSVIATRTATTATRGTMRCAAQRHSAPPSAPRLTARPTTGRRR